MIRIKNTQRVVRVHIPLMKERIQNVMRSFRLPDYQLGVWFASDDYVQQLNKTYRNIDKPTNVLSIPAFETQQLASNSFDLQHLFRWMERDEDFQAIRAIESEIEDIQPKEIITPQTTTTTRRKGKENTASNSTLDESDLEYYSQHPHTFHLRRPTTEEGVADLGDLIFGMGVILEESQRLYKSNINNKNSKSRDSNATTPSEYYNIDSSIKLSSSSPSSLLNYHTTLLIIHGLCHLIGYQHDTDEQYKEMRAREIFTMRKLIQIEGKPIEDNQELISIPPTEQ